MFSVKININSLSKRRRWENLVISNILTKTENTAHISFMRTEVTTEKSLHQNKDDPNIAPYDSLLCYTDCTESIL